MKLNRPKLAGVRKYWNLLLAMSRATLAMTVAIAAVIGLMLYKLGSLLPGLSEAEINTYHNTNSLSIIGENMVNAPYKLAVYLTTQVFDSAFGLRLVGAMLGILTVVVFYLLVRRLFSPSITVASTALFASSSLVLAASRQATPQVMLFTLLIVVGTGFFLRFSRRPDIAWILTAVVIGLALYVPGMVFFILAAILWQFRHARHSFEQLKTPVVATVSVIFGLLCVPLIISLVRDPSLWRAYLGLPETFAPFSEMVKYAGTAVISLFARSPYESTWWLGRQPALDVFATVMFIYGGFNLLRQYRLDRLWTIAGIFLLSIAWIGATTNRIAIIMLLPFVYIVVGVGLQNFVNKWLTVFPRNPIARWAGGLLLAAAVLVAMNFQLHRYFVAWPNSDTTKAVYIHQYPR